MSESIRTIADVKISQTDEGVVSVLLNGEEMNHQILDGSLAVEFPEGASDGEAARVTMTLFANVDLDLPAVEVEVR